MIEKLLAWTAIVFGIVWALKPEVLRNGLTNKTYRFLVWAALGTLFFPLIRLLGRAAGLIGIVLALILLWFALSLAYRAIREVFLKAPAACFQALGILNIAGGIWILRMR